MFRIRFFGTVILVLMAATFSSGVLTACPEESAEKTALLIIDVQQFYFPGGFSPLLNPEAAAQTAKKLLDFFRLKGETVIHIRHNAKTNAEFYPLTAPVDGEKVFSKDNVNSFRETGLLEFLKEKGIGKLAICGMMTHMCVEAATRAAVDYGFQCTVIHDACASKDLVFNGKTVKGEDVHLSTLSSLSGYYARVLDGESFLKEFK